MLVNKILKVVLLLLGVVFVVLQGFAFEVEGAAVSTLMLVLVTALYCRYTEHKTKYFFWFLVIFTVAHFLSLTSRFLPEIETDQIELVQKVFA
jgi:protein-S-isoprenylcysteine O-methyltransferase Ste14